MKKNAMTNTSKKIPDALVKTWIEVLMHGDKQEAREHAKNMLIGAFGSEAAAIAYIKKNKLRT